MPSLAIVVTTLLPIARAALMVIVGLTASTAAAPMVRSMAVKRLGIERAELIVRAVRYAMLAVAFTEALHELGFDLTVLLGTAGVLSVAVGFASQTSASNLVSGLFLIMEQPFSVGDAIQVGDTTGEVTAIDLLSTKLRTFDNLFVRIPNETLMRNTIINLSRYPIRRFEVPLVLPHDQDPKRVEALLLARAERNDTVLEAPGPRMLFDGLDGDGARWRFVAWATRETLIETRVAFAAQVREALVEAGIPLAAHRVRVETAAPPIPGASP